jgi:hypothetical protein
VGKLEVSFIMSEKIQIVLVDPLEASSSGPGSSKAFTCHKPPMISVPGRQAACRSWAGIDTTKYREINYRVTFTLGN